MTTGMCSQGFHILGSSRGISIPVRDKHCAGGPLMVAGYGYQYRSVNFLPVPTYIPYLQGRAVKMVLTGFCK